MILQVYFDIFNAYTKAPIVVQVGVDLIQNDMQEIRYSNIKREIIEVVFGLEIFYHFIFGTIE